MPKKRIPSYRLHKPSGRAVVTLKGKDFYLGQYNSKASWDEYQRIIGEYIANDCKLPPTRSRNEITCEELAIQYLEWAEGYFEQNTHSIDRCQRALAPFVRHYGGNAVSEFGPFSLIFIRDKWIDAGIARETINKWCSIIKQCVRWGVARELVPADILHALEAVDNLKAGRTKAPEYREVEPVADDIVDATIPFLSPIVADMIQIQRLAGLRPQDVYNMRACDIDRSREVWVYRPFKHKTKHRGKVRELAIGPKAQEIILPYIVRKSDNPEAFLFSPADSKRLYFEEKRAKRKSKVQPSQANRKRENPKRIPGQQYTKDSYNRAITKACKKAGIPSWSPNQLRHSAGTEIRDKYGLEYAQAVLGHSNAKTTEIYAEINFEKAAKVMREIG